MNLGSNLPLAESSLLLMRVQRSSMPSSRLAFCLVRIACCLSASRAFFACSMFFSMTMSSASELSNSNPILAVKFFLAPRFPLLVGYLAKIFRLRLTGLLTPNEPVDFEFAKSLLLASDID